MTTFMIAYYTIYYTNFSTVMYRYKEKHEPMIHLFDVIVYNDELSRK